MGKRVNGKLLKRSRRRSTERDAYWQDQIRQLGRKVFYVDTGAILECLNPEDDRFNAFFEGVVGGRLVTSSYVVAETVSRLVKAKPYKFVGPAGQQGCELAVHFLRGWLEERDVSVLYIPQEVFVAARAEFEQKKSIGCDLTDVISYLIVVGLEQSHIVSPDGHFRTLGLMCLP
ncbi:MAG TPA: PIN domain-containing protein [Phycisphaerae bacterium]|nr:PIN domain-containing protein [Phycisphaerae bacterium]